MTAQNILLAAFSVISIYASAQVYSHPLYVFDFQTRIIDSIPPLLYDSSVHSLATQAGFGTMNGFDTLPLSTPQNNLVPGTELIRKHPASSDFDLTDYPIRTAVAIGVPIRDSLGNVIGIGSHCSGTLIAPDFVISAGHCFKYIFTDTSFHDSLYIVPVYDKGQFTANIPRSFAVKIYEIADYVQNPSPAGPFRWDISLIKLSAPIGNLIGWQGIAYNNDNQFFENKNMHKFSYPNVPMSWDSVAYNGDTLYYEYGQFHTLPDNSIGLPTVQGGTWGNPGQSGSGLFYTNNLHDYHLYATLTAANNFTHTRLTSSMFHSFNAILQQPLSTAVPKVETDYEIEIYPNPFANQLFIQCKDLDANAVYSIVDVNGRILRSGNMDADGKQNLNLSELPTGLYLLHIVDDKLQFTKKIIKIN